MADRFKDRSYLTYETLQPKTLYATASDKEAFAAFNDISDIEWYVEPPVLAPEHLDKSTGLPVRDQFWVEIDLPSGEHVFDGVLLGSHLASESPRRVILPRFESIWIKRQGNF